MRKSTPLSIISIFLLLSYLCFYPITLEPISRKTPPFPGLKGVFKPNSLLAGVELIGVPKPGPEAIVQDSLGFFYTGLSNGKILMFDKTGSNQKIIANTEGRPLGLAFAPTGDLVIADQKRGLLALNQQHQLRILVDSFQGEKLLFIDDLEVSKEGIIYFSNATQRNPLIVENEAWEQRASGALFSFDLQTEKITLLKDQLFFANGIAIHSSQDYFLFSETFGLTLSRYWINGPKKGKVELFSDQLPGFPDNITFSNGIFWVAIPSQRAVHIEPLFELPFIRSVILRLPAFVRNAVIPSRYAMVIGYDEDGKVVYNLQDPKGKHDYITSALQVDDKLYLGSLKEPHFAIYTLQSNPLIDEK